MSDSNDIGKRTDISVGKGWWKYAKAGDRIVCIADETNLPRNRNGHTAVHGQVYTIADIQPPDRFYGAAADTMALQILEDGHWYNAKGFRPVQPLRKSTEKGVQLLKDIAARKREPEEV